MNPLRKLCDQLGLTADVIAAKGGLDSRLVEAALLEAPKNELSTFLAICEELGVKMRIAAGERFEAWVSLSSVDALHANKEWRKSVGLIPLPPDKGQLVAQVRFLRKRHSWTYGEIARHFEANWIPTADGLRNWRGSTIGHICEGGKVFEAEMPVGYTNDFAREFRQFVADEAITRICRFDAFAPVRYQLTAEQGEVLRIYAGAPMPSIATTWMRDGMKALGWFKEWGFGKEKATGTGESPDLHPVQTKNICASSS